MSRGHLLLSVVLLTGVVGITNGGTQTAAPLAKVETTNGGTFVLHKFAKAIGTETYSIETKGDEYTLTSHFLFTDRGTKVPLETTFMAKSADMVPVSYIAKGQSSRLSKMDDALVVNGNAEWEDRYAHAHRCVVHHRRLFAGGDAGTDDALVVYAWETR